ncbi:MAG: hypothetical protein Q8P18_18905 [Pseudomonadota bacterium]|nr:hypothetical protein [Pseudomonadota bacterium]
MAPAPVAPASVAPAAPSLPAPRLPAPVVAVIPVEPPPPVVPADPAEAWKCALGVLSPHQRVVVEENAAFVSFEGGTLALVVRVEQWRPVVREHLQEVDFVSVLPGFRRFDIRRGDEGQTGREFRNEADERRAAAAREAVAASAVVKRLVAMLDGRVEYTEASKLDEGDRSTNSEESSDD